jgi:hypothetical protein
MDPIDFFFIEAFIFSEQLGRTWTREVACPWCGCVFELEVDIAHVHDENECCECGGGFAIDWEEGTVERVE